METPEIIALVGIGLSVVGPAYALIWTRLTRLEEKISNRVRALHGKIDTMAERVVRIETKVNGH